MDGSYHRRNMISAVILKARLQRAGVTGPGYKLWTADEIDILRRTYPDMQTMRRLLPQRTEQAIRAKSSILGLKRQFQHRFTAAEISRLRRMFPTASQEEIMTHFPGMTWKNISQACNTRGFRRTRTYMRTGSPLIDSILTRLEEIGWRLRDLDAECGTKDYFQLQQWRYCPHNSSAVAKAVKVLGGHLECVWDD